MFEQIDVPGSDSAENPVKTWPKIPGQIRCPHVRSKLSLSGWVWVASVWSMIDQIGNGLCCLCSMFGQIGIVVMFSCWIGIVLLCFVLDRMLALSLSAP